MKIFVSDISHMKDLAGSGLLTQARLERMLRYLQRPDQMRCLVAGLMLRRVFGTEQASRVTASALGKPYLPDGPCFNLSHSGNKVVLLVDDQDAGVDVEQIVPYSGAVARRVFTPREQEWLQSRNNEEAFFRLWTGKESIMKALGLGLQLPPESFEIRPEISGPNTVCGREWFLHWLELDGHMLCCASCVPDKKTEITVLTREELLQQRFTEVL